MKSHENRNALRIAIALLRAGKERNGGTPPVPPAKGLGPLDSRLIPLIRLVLLGVQAKHLPAAVGRFPRTLHTKRKELARS
jgi:hypothetical protein